MICELDTTRPSAVLMMAQRTPTPISAASQVGKSSMKRSGREWLGLAPSR